MKLVKGLALSLLNLLLFLSLSIFGLARTLNNTILNPDFVVSEVDRLDISSLAKEFISEQIPPEGELMAEVLDDTITDLEPWIKEQVNAGIYSSYDYLMGRSQSLSLVISLEPLRDSLKSNLGEAVLRSPPPELAGVPPAVIELYISQYIDEILTNLQIPPTFEFNESSLSPEVLAQLEQVKQAIGYFQAGYKALIGFILLLILGIILINRQVKGASRGIGITFLTCGAIGYLETLAAKYFAGTQLAQLDIPSQLQVWLPQLVDDFLVPLEMFSIGLLAGGVALIIVSFLYKPRQPSF